MHANHVDRIVVRTKNETIGFSKKYYEKVSIVEDSIYFKIIEKKSQKVVYSSY